MKIIPFILFLSLLFGVFSCKNEGKELINELVSQAETPEKEFNSDTLFDTILGGFEPHIVQIQVNGKVGLFDSIKNELITPIKYDEIGYFSGDNIIDYKLGEKYGFVDGKGKEITPAVYDFVTGFENGFSSVEGDGKWGFVNRKGELIIPLEFDNAYNFHLKDFAAVSKDGKWGFINSNGKYVIEPIFDNVTWTFDDELPYANVSVKSHSYFINTKGEFVKDSNPYDKYHE